MRLNEWLQYPGTAMVPVEEEATTTTARVIEAECACEVICEVLVEW
jgi:hypothetical protein